MSQVHQFAWQALAAHIGADRVNDLASSRRRFAAHLLPDLQAAIVAEMAPFQAALLGIHQPYEHQALTISDLSIREGHSVVAITPLQYQDMDIGEAEPFAALNNGLWVFRVQDAPVVVLLSPYNDYFGKKQAGTGGDRLSADRGGRAVCPRLSGAHPAGRR